MPQGLEHPVPSPPSLAIGFGGDEDQAIAGLLHDTLEDCGEAHEAVVRSRFGDAVADIVRDCTDAHLKEAADATLLVSACDKVHNARAIVQDLEDPEVGTRVFDRFTGGRDGTLGYCQSLAKIFVARGARVAGVLDATVGWMHEPAGVGARTPLSQATPSSR
jgi:hypothetical protein